MVVVVVAVIQRVYWLGVMLHCGTWPVLCSALNLHKWKTRD